MKQLLRIICGLALCFTVATVFAQTYSVSGGAVEPAYNTQYLDLVGLPIMQNGNIVGWINIFIDQSQSGQVYGDVSLNLGTYQNYVNKVFNLTSVAIAPLSGAVDWPLIKYPTPAACYPAASNCGSIQFTGVSGDGHALTMAVNADCQAPSRYPYTLRDEAQKAAIYHAEEGQKHSAAADFLAAHPEFDDFIRLVRSGAIRF